MRANTFVDVSLGVWSAQRTLLRLRQWFGGHMVRPRVIREIQLAMPAKWDRGP